MSEVLEHRVLSAARRHPHWSRLIQLAATLLVAVYMLFIGGTFDGGLRYQVQLFNTLGASLVAIVWLAARVRRGGPLTATGLEWPLGGFALSQWLALLTSAQPRLGLEWVASVTVWVVALLILCDVLRHGWPRAYFIQALLLLASLVTALGLAEVALWYASWLGQGHWPPFVFRLNGWLGHANLTAAFLNTLLPLTLVRCLRAKHTAQRLGLAALAAGMLIVLFFTSSRAGWLAGGLGLALFCALVWLRPGGSMSLAGLRTVVDAWPRAARGLLIVGGLGAAGVVARLLIAQSEHITHGPLFSSRELFWRIAWYAFQLRPLTGAGPDLYPWFYTRWAASPPLWLAPHAHSLVLQILAGSGLVGLAALLWLVSAAALQLARRWLAAPDRLMLAGLGAGLAGFGVQQLFDYLLGSTLMVFVIVVVFALALSEVNASQPPRSYPPWSLAPLMAAPLAVAVFALRGAALNDRGLALAAEGNWPAAARAFEQAAGVDPGLTLYWQQAAYAFTRADDLAAALPLWQRAAHDDPNWPLLSATAGVLAHDRDPLQQALDRAGAMSHLFALNLGVLAEQDGDATAAQADYQRALNLRPDSVAALFWQQTALRRSVRDTWLAARGDNTTTITLGQQALATGQPRAAQAYFEAALAQSAVDILAYAGLAEAYHALGDTAQAEATVQTGMRVPVETVEQTLGLRLLAGDLARARADTAAAAEAYSLVFSAINDYTLYGPGTYGHPQRSWYVFRRPALPADLVPQLARADITAEMDERFAWLAAWLRQEGSSETACFVTGRVWREAPESRSGAFWTDHCR